MQLYSTLLPAIIALCFACADHGNAGKILNNKPSDPVSRRDSLVAQLAAMKTDTLDCSAEAYWNIVAKGNAYVPDLIELLTDTTPTSIYNGCKNGNLNVGELSWFALEEIGDFPVYVVTRIQFDVIEMKDGWSCWSFYGYLFENSNKPALQEKVRDFYETSQFRFVRFSGDQLTDCRRLHHITGRYKWKKKGE